ncbi:MAG: DUF11 domain-containing protein [Clostridia bacterium]|nr:DUF11 domain-containing protein [Clostridia bacterium]
MAIITNQANLTYTYGTTTASVASNVATAEMSAALSASKRVLDESYRLGSDLTYILSFENVGSSAITNLSVLDDLGAYTPEGATAPVQPLTYTGPAALYIDGVFSAELTPAVQDGGVLFTIPEIPAGSNAMLVYQTTVNGFAPLTPGSEIENTASVGTTDPQTVSATVPAASYADVSITKEMAPDPVSTGDTMTVTFTIENRGNADATDLQLTDDFPLALTDVSVTVNGAPMTDFTFENSTLTVPSGTQTTLSVPAAAFTQDETGAVTVVPGKLTVVLTGMV